MQNRTVLCAPTDMLVERLIGRQPSNDKPNLPVSDELSGFFDHAALASRSATKKKPRKEATIMVPKDQFLLHLPEKLRLDPAKRKSLAASTSLKAAGLRSSGNRIAQSESMFGPAATVDAGWRGICGPKNAEACFWAASWARLAGASWRSDVSQAPPVFLGKRRNDWSTRSTSAAACSSECTAASPRQPGRLFRRCHTASAPPVCVGTPPSSMLTCTATATRPPSLPPGGSIGSELISMLVAPFCCHSAICC